jgi:hypothetical protein
MYKSHRIIEIGDDDEVLVVDFYADVVLEDTGIGPYEFHGSKGVHREETPICQDVDWDKSGFTEAENQVIERYLTENIEDIESEIESDYENQNP